jgi:hypothetical protein
VNVARDHFLADAAFAGDQDRGFGRRDLIGQRDSVLHRFVGGDQRAIVVAHGREHGGDQFGVRRQRDVLARAGADRFGRDHRIDADARGHDRHDDVLSLVRRDQSGDVEARIDHQQIGAAPARSARVACSIVSTWATFAP